MLKFGLERKITPEKSHRRGSLRLSAFPARWKLWRMMEVGVCDREGAVSCLPLRPGSLRSQRTTAYSPSPPYVSRVRGRMSAAHPREYLLVLKLASSPFRLSAWLTTPLICFPETCGYTDSCCRGVAVFGRPNVTIVSDSVVQGRQLFLWPEIIDKMNGSSGKASEASGCWKQSHYAK